MTDEFFSLGMSTVLHKCHDIIDALPEDADPLEAVINLPVQYPVDTERTRAHLVPGNMESPLGVIHKDGELKTVFGTQACAQFNIFEVLAFFSNTVVDRTDEDIAEYERTHPDA